ncbi:MAG: hypothetical protein ACYDD6_09025, partial [Acidimicrobiales bacterium]
MLGLVPRGRRRRARLAGATAAGLLAAICGAWFVIGVFAWPVFEHFAGVFTPASPLRTLAEEVGYCFGPGVLLVLLGALAMGRAGRRPDAAGAPRLEREGAVR